MSISNHSKKLTALALLAVPAILYVKKHCQEQVDENGKPITLRSHFDHAVEKGYSNRGSCCE